MLATLMSRYWWVEVRVPAGVAGAFSNAAFLPIFSARSGSRTPYNSMSLATSPVHPVW